MCYNVNGICVCVTLLSSLTMLCQKESIVKSSETNWPCKVSIKANTTLKCVFPSTFTENNDVYFCISRHQRIPWDPQ